MKFLQKFYVWFLILLLPFLLGAKHSGCSFFEAIFFTNCSPNPGAQFNSIGTDVNDQAILVCDAGKIYVGDEICSSNFVLLTVQYEPNLNDVTFFANNSTGNIIVGDNGTLVRLTPDHQLDYLSNPAGSYNLNAVEGYGFNPSIIFAVGNSGTVIRSTDGGLTWTLLDFINQADLEEVDVEDDGLYVVVGGSDYTAAQSTDGGETWTQIAVGDKPSSGGSMGFRAIYFYDDNLGFVGGPWGLAAKTTNGGTDWTTFSLPDFDNINSIYFSSPDSGIAVGTPGIARFTTDGGASWFEDPDVTTFLNGQNIRKIIPADNHIGYVIGEGSYFLTVADDSTLLTPVEEEFETLPDEYTLSQNYPNPFNPLTTIRYSVPQIELVTLKVFDVLGSEVAILVNEEKPVGNYEVEFDANSLPSGVYLYQLKAGSYVETRKMILLR